MQQIPFSLIFTGLKTAVLAVALGFQMLPFFLLVVVAAHALDVTGREALAFVPMIFFAVVFAACWLTARRPHPGPPAPRQQSWRPESWPGHKWRQGPELLIKTRAERYQDLKDILGRTWR